MQTRLTSAIFLVLLALTGIVYTIVVGNEPLLGLDLQGGVSVVLQPTQEVSEETLDQTVEIIRSRVDGLGVAEPEISRQGNNIVVDLPGVEEQQRALALVGQTAELRFRPVILGPDQMNFINSSGGFQPTEETGDSPGANIDSTDTTQPGMGEHDDDDVDTADEEGSLRPIRGRQDDNTTTTTTESTQTTNTQAGDEDTEVVPDDQAPVEPTPDPALSPSQVAAFAACSDAIPFAPEDDLADAYVVLEDPVTGGIYCLGPTLLKGDALESADSGFDGFIWSVNPTFRAGPEGIDAFNAIAAICSEPFVPANTEICPVQGRDSSGIERGALAIVLDHEVISAPTIGAPPYSRDRVQISGSFTEDEARNLALALNYGALPVELEAQQTRTVSATIGDDVLRSGIIAGSIGLLLVAAYVLAYYRLAGFVAISGLIISGLLLWTVISWLGETKGLAITLSGVVGLIVSIGVSADSNIVYFENVKDSVSVGKRVTTSVERAYRSAIGTILKADTVSMIAAVLLYFLTVGAVRGFAFYLGLATLLDLLVSYLFMRPALAWLARLDKVKQNPALLGMPVGGKS